MKSENVARLIAEYRPSMPVEVLHLWAEAAVCIRSQSAALASAREVIDGKPGTMPLSDEDLDTIESCVRNDQHQRILALEIMELTRLYRAAREWKGR